MNRLEAETDEQYGDGVDEVENKQASNRQPLMISHGKYFNEYGEPIQNPAFGIDPAGNPVNLPHMEQTPEEKIRNQELHKLKYHNDLTISRANNIVGGPKDSMYSRPNTKGNKFQQLYLFYLWINRP